MPLLLGSSYVQDEITECADKSRLEKRRGCCSIENNNIELGYRDSEHCNREEQKSVVIHSRDNNRGVVSLESSAMQGMREKSALQSIVASNRRNSAG